MALSEMDKMEPLLRENRGKYCMFPIVHEEIWKMYKKAEASFWTGACGGRGRGGAGRARSVLRAES